MKRPITTGIIIHRAERIKGNDYHYLVLKDGEYKRLVPPQDIAFHAMSFNKETMAIAVFGCFASSEPGLNWYPTLSQLSTVKLLINQIKAWYPSVLWIAGHSELGRKGTAFPTKLLPGHTCPGENFPLDEIIASSGLIHLPPKPISANLIV